MDLGLRGRTALVCASTGGLGEALARALAAEDANVVVSGRRGERARQVAADLPRAVGIEVDLTSRDGPATLFAAAMDAFGAVDVLVLNGPGPAPGSAVDVTADGVDQAIHTLVLPQQQMVSLVLPAMRAKGWGRVLAIGSSGVAAPLPNLALSNLGRAALAGYLKTLATEVAGDGVTVNMLLPGRIATDRVASLDRVAAERRGIPVEQVQATSRQSIPAGRYGRVAEFGAVGAFLCSDQAAYVTGVALRCDGGLVRSL
jgi:3-oxoacyl-[acyl-carrier protein] reductase